MENVNVTVFNLLEGIVFFLLLIERVYGSL